MVRLMLRRGLSSGIDNVRHRANGAADLHQRAGNCRIRRLRRLVVRANNTQNATPHTARRKHFLQRFVIAKLA